MGTSSDKAVLVDYKGSIKATAVEPYPTYYPNPAWVEQDPEDYWKAAAQSSRAIIDKTGISPEQIGAVVFSTQAQGVIPVDEKGKALYTNITWVDGRAQKQADSIMRKLGGKKLFTMVAGTPVMGKDCIPKIIWLKEERPEIYEKTWWKTIYLPEISGKKQGKGWIYGVYTGPSGNLNSQHIFVESA